MSTQTLERFDTRLSNELDRTWELILSLRSSSVRDRMDMGRWLSFLKDKYQELGASSQFGRDAREHTGFCSATLNHYITAYKVFGHKADTVLGKADWMVWVWLSRPSQQQQKQRSDRMLKAISHGKSFWSYTRVRFEFGVGNGEQRHFRRYTMTVPVGRSSVRVKVHVDGKLSPAAVRKAVIKNIDHLESI